MYKIKQIPEDFKVTEAKDVAISDSGEYMICRLTKKDYTTQKSVELISHFFNIKQKSIGYAGTKDRHAITTQYVSIRGNDIHRLKNFKVDGINLEFLGFSKTPISLGELDGNAFEITVRNLDSEEKYSDALDSFEDNAMSANYFDEQRFSTNNVETGRAIVKRNFKKAAELISETNPDVKKMLDDNKSDFIGALRKLPSRILLLYVHSYQSYLFNSILAKYIEEKSDDYREVDYSLGKFAFPNDAVGNMELPIIGFDTEEDESVEELLEEENISARSFVIREIPGLSCEGGTRDAFVDVEDFSFEFSGDELNNGKKKCLLKFKLPKGSYATLVVKQIFGGA